MSDNTLLYSKLGLGTVQFGMAYGVANRTGRVSGTQLAKVMALARQHRISVLDTASAYGQSEAALGQYLNNYKNARVITKTPHFSSRKTTEADTTLLRSTFAQSLHSLRVESIYGLLLHRGTDLLRPNAGLLWAEMEKLKTKKKVCQLGVSVYTPEELSEVLDQFPIDIVQLPMNILDQRFRRCGLLKELDEGGIEVHVRSAFLQGVLVTEPNNLPDYFNPLRPHLLLLREEANKLGISMLEMALKYLLNLREIDTVLVGVDSAQQLLQILNAVEGPITTDLDWDRWAIDEPRWIMPNHWQVE